MKKKICILLIIAVAIITISIFCITKISNHKKSDNFIYVGDYNDDLIHEENYLFTDYNELKEIFSLDLVKPEDFDKSNYALIKILYDECSESNIEPYKYKIDGKNIDVLVKYESSCGVCAPNYLYYLLPVDKSIRKVNVNIEYERINEPDCDPNVEYKPMIYLYPEEETLITLKFEKEENLITTYPKYNNNWTFLATKDGILRDVNTNRIYYGLYWEGKNHYSQMLDDGFIVSKEDLIPFLEEKLEILGLNELEAEEFIVYWLPILEQSEYNYIRFETDYEINDYMPLIVSPKPDTVIRILMDYKPLKDKIDIKEQKLVSKKRQGFTLIEWGGSLIN